MALHANGDVTVIGAGVSGLTTAVALAEAGHRVRVIADRMPKDTTSAVAGASWGPETKADGRVVSWSHHTLEILEELALTSPESGVRLVWGLEASAVDEEPPAWARAIVGYQRCAAADLPPGYRTGWRYRVPIVDMPIYLQYLCARLKATGTVIEAGHVATLDSLAGLGAIVVNCTGLAARELVGDTALTPKRGQLVVVENTGIDTFFQDHVDGPDWTYILPHARYVILGGHAADGSEQLTSDSSLATAIIERCARIDPRLSNPNILGFRVGLRPYRPHVRLETQQVEGGHLIHNYGHGGGGITLSWGCAESVRERVADLVGSVTSAF